jgi:hypothetical protein
LKVKRLDKISGQEREEFTDRSKKEKEEETDEKVNRIFYEDGL